MEGRDESVRNRAGFGRSLPCLSEAFRFHAIESGDMIEISCLKDDSFTKEEDGLEDGEVGRPVGRILQHHV